MTSRDPDQPRISAPRTSLLLALLLASACARGSIPGEVTSPDTAPPERGGAEAGAAVAPAPRHERVAFDWKSGDEAVSGTIKTTLPDGETFTGKFHEITRTTTVDKLGGFYGDWYAGPWGEPTMTWGDAWPYYGSIEEFITRYTGKAVATLTGDRGTKMRCHFRLDDPDRGMKGGGTGECQTSDGQRITSRFEPQ